MINSMKLLRRLISATRTVAAHCNEPWSGDANKVREILLGTVAPLLPEIDEQFPGPALTYEKAHAACTEMKSRGGHFASKLADAFFYADSDNAQRIILAFDDLLRNYLPAFVWTDPTGMFRSLTEEEVEQFRQWAHRNYTPGTAINSTWHPVVQEECRLINEARGAE